MDKSDLVRLRMSCLDHVRSMRRFCWASDVDAEIKGALQLEAFVFGSDDWLAAEKALQFVCKPSSSDAKDLAPLLEKAARYRDYLSRPHDPGPATAGEGALIGNDRVTESA